MVDAIQKIVIIVMGIVHVNVRNIFPSTEGVGLYRGSLFTSSVIPVSRVIGKYIKIFSYDTHNLYKVFFTGSLVIYMYL